MRILFTYGLLLALSAHANLAIDQTSATDRLTPSSTISTEPFNIRTQGELLLAFICTDDIGSTNVMVKSVSSAGLTWTLVKRTNAQYGTAEIWEAVSNQVTDNVSVTATISQSVNASLTVCTFTGANLTNPIGASAGNNSISGAPTVSLITTAPNSWVMGCGNDYDNAEARVLGPNQKMIHQFLSPSADTYWSQMQVASTPNSGSTVTINDTSPVLDRFNMSAIEVLAAASTGPPTYNQWETTMNAKISAGISPPNLLQWVDNNPPYQD
jgi:hypothetical protein